MKRILDSATTTVRRQRAKFRRLFAPRHSSALPAELFGWQENIEVNLPCHIAQKYSMVKVLGLGLHGEVALISLCEVYWQRLYWEKFSFVPVPASGARDGEDRSTGVRSAMPGVWEPDSHGAYQAA